MLSKLIDHAIFRVGVLASIFLVGCSTDGFTRVKTTDGYLSETKINLPKRESEDIGRIVFIRQEMQNKNIPTVFINDRVVGSLPVKRYSETLVCPGEQIIRIGTRADVVKKGQDQRYVIPAGSTQYLQVYETSGEEFGFRVLTEQEVRQIKGLTESHIINRHQPICNTPLKVIKSVNLGADALFKFDTTQMLPAGQAKVDKLIQDIHSLGAQVEKIRIIGHTDRLGAVPYNDRLSLGRAQAVAHYMKQNGLDNIQMETDGRGSREPVTHGCSDGFAKARLINCLQPDRRVSIDLMGTVEQIENKGIGSK